MKKTPTLIIAGVSLAALGATQVAPYLTPTGVTPGDYTSANITVNAFGQITAATNGTGGSGGSIVSSNNTFTGTNTFSAPVTFNSSLAVNELLVVSNMYAPTRTLGDDSTNVATTAFVQDAVGAVAGYYVLYLFNINSLAPADSTTYYTGDLVDPTTTWSRAAVPVPVTGTVRGWWANIDKTTGTGEDVAMMLRHNDTTDFGGVTNNWSSIYQTFASTNLSRSVTAGDTVAFKFATPAWVTNPSGMRMRVKVLISVP